MPQPCPSRLHKTYLSQRIHEGIARMYRVATQLELAGSSSRCTIGMECNSRCHSNRQLGGGNFAAEVCYKWNCSSIRPALGPQRTHSLCSMASPRAAHPLPWRSGCPSPDSSACLKAAPHCFCSWQLTARYHACQQLIRE